MIYHLLEGVQTLGCQQFGLPATEIGTDRGYTLDVSVMEGCSLAEILLFINIMSESQGLHCC